ncbi:hypothetical protein ACFQX4_25170 [Roseomonas sp. GCM10028921]
MSPPSPPDQDLAPGTRIGRYLVFRDVDGRRHALAATAVLAACEEEDGDVLLLLPGGRAVRVAVPLWTALAWLDGKG